MSSVSAVETGGRAIAESVVGLAWRYMMGALAGETSLTPPV